MEKYKAYTPSTIFWNFDKPCHWDCQKAKRVFRTLKELNKENIENNVLSLTLNGVIRNNTSKPIGLSPKDYCTYQIFEKNDLVFKLIDLENISTSRVGLVPERGIMSSAYIRLQLKSKQNIRYFYYQYLDWYKRNIFNGLGAGVRQTMSSSDLMNLEILIPPYKEQNQIVRYLDWQTSKINELIVSKKKQIKILRERQQKLICHVITKGLHEHVNYKNSHIAWIGSIPDHWSTIRCKYLFKERDERSKEGLETHLSMSQKYGLVPDTKLDERRMLSESYAGGKLCYQDDIVLNRLKAHLGVFAIAPQFGVISPDYTVLIPNTERVIPSFVEMVLKSVLCRRELRVRVRGIIEGFWRLYTDDFYTIHLPVPPIEEQKEIMQYIDAEAKKTAAVENALNKEIELLHELRSSLISDAVTGQRDVQNIKVPDIELIKETVDEIEELEDEMEVK